VEGAFAAGQALDYYARIFIYKNCHMKSTF